MQSSALRVEREGVERFRTELSTSRAGTPVPSIFEARRSALSGVRQNLQAGIARECPSKLSW